VAPGTWVTPEELRGVDGWTALYARWGWQLDTPPATLNRWNYFAGTDGERSQLLQRLWSDEHYAGLVCVGGGWGAQRVLEAGLRLPEVPRWFVGFSDNCALQMAQLAAGAGGGIHGWRGERVRQLLSGEPVAPLQGQGWARGRASGALVVTNLTVATHLVGTPWLPDLNGVILVIEDTGEAPYRIDRLLTHWRTAGLLQRLAGLGLGRFDWTSDGDVLPGDLTIEEVLRDRCGDLGIPVVGRLPVGHGRPNKALPQGRRAELDGSGGSLTLLS
jgi:muramoyltetrapeptide carboxypeptidase